MDATVSDSTARHKELERAFGARFVLVARRSSGRTNFASLASGLEHDEGCVVAAGAEADALGMHLVVATAYRLL